jgi:ABC-2 type transport system ATP-binding protein
MTDRVDQVLHVAGASHSYGSTHALAGVDLSVSAGECVALLGPNGAGKTTLVRSVIGLITPDVGTVRVAGADPRLATTRARMGVVQQEVGFPRTLTVFEVVAGAAGRAGVDPSRAADALAEMGLAELGRRRASDLSGGQQQRLQLAMGLVADPVLLVMDEPTVGLDVVARRAFWETIRRRREQGVGVLLTTHQVDEAADVADRVVVVHRGRVVATGSPEELRRSLPDRMVTARTSLSPAFVRALDGVASVEEDRGVLRVVTAQAEAVVRELLTADPHLAELAVSVASLDDVLVSTTVEVAA